MMERMRYFFFQIFVSIVKNSHFRSKMGLTMIILLVSQISGASTKLDEAKKYFSRQQYKEAHAQLNNIPLEQLDPNRMSLIEFFRGIIFFEQKNYNFAIRHIDKALKIGTRLEDVANYFKGLSYLELNNSEEALKAFRLVDKKDPSKFLEEKSDFKIAEILFETQKYNDANDIFKRLERKMRSSEVYPDILWSLLKINHLKKKRLDACYWARKLYKKYPIYEPVAHWGLRWEGNLVDGKPLNCKDTLDDQQDRIKRLQLMGASEKAYSELKEFQKSKEEPFIKDMTMAEYLINEGMVREAFDRLKPYYQDKNKQKNEDFVSLFGKAATRAGEYQAATGIYLKASEDFPGHKGRRYLFTAGFLSYQNQDYDGALRRFEVLAKKYSFTYYGKQANWYIPWVYYLKGHYQKSYDKWKWALKHRRSKLPRSVTSEKLKYWMAMSLKRLGNREAAKDLFLELSQDDYIGYYSIASVQRLKGMIGSRALASVQHDEALTLHENWLPHFSDGQISSGDLEQAEISVAEKTNDVFHAEWEKLPYMREYVNMGKPTEIYATVSEPEFRRHIARAKDLSLMGMSELAKWELYSIEGRTRNEEYLKTLMFEYFRNDIFHRSAYIGTSHFAGDRTHLGLHIGAALWQYVYPRAFEDQVLSSAKKYDVPPEFIWSIMKAETNFRPDAMSPVGARGLMQVMTHTGRKVASMIGIEITGDDLFRPQVSIEIGARYLQRNLKKFKGKIPLAAAAYNGGPHRVHSWLYQFGRLDMDEFIEHIPFQETRRYVKKVTSYYTLYNLLYNKDANASSWLSENVNVHLEGTPPTRETWEVL